VFEVADPPLSELTRNLTGFPFASTVAENVFELFDVWPMNVDEIAALAGILSENGLPNNVTPGAEKKLKDGLLLTRGESLL